MNNNYPEILYVVIEYINDFKTNSKTKEYRIFKDRDFGRGCARIIWFRSHNVCRTKKIFKTNFFTENNDIPLYSLKEKYEIEDHFLSLDSVENDGYAHEVTLIK